MSVQCVRVSILVGVAVECLGVSILSVGIYILCLIMCPLCVGVSIICVVRRSENAKFEQLLFWWKRVYF